MLFRTFNSAEVTRLATDVTSGNSGQLDQSGHSGSGRMEGISIRAGQKLY